MFSPKGMLKGRISKHAFQKKQSTPYFPKKEHFLPPGTHMYVCASGGGVGNVRFSENMACFVFLNTRFEIRPFALLSTFSSYALKTVSV